MIAKVLNDIFNKENENVQDIKNPNHQENDTNKNKQSGSSGTYRSMFDTNESYSNKSHQEDVKNDSVLFPKYEMYSVGDFTFYKKNDLTLLGVIFRPEKIFNKIFYSKSYGNQVPVSDTTGQKRKSNAREEESRTIQAVQEGEKRREHHQKIFDLRDRIKNEHSRNSTSNDKIQGQYK